MTKKKIRKVEHEQAACNQRIANNKREQLEVAKEWANFAAGALALASFVSMTWTILLDVVA